MEALKELVSNVVTATDETKERLRKRQSRKIRRKVKDDEKKGRRASYVVIPKGRRLHRKVIAKLENENFHYTIARAIDLARKYQKFTEAEQPYGNYQLSDAEMEWRSLQVSSDEEAAYRIERLRARELRRRHRQEMLEKLELYRKKYRINPEDPNFRYIEGYEQRRHRITKERFMRCVDVPLFKEVLERNEELQDSPIWHEHLNLKNLTYTEAETLKDHIQRFEVIVEALKQGIFDYPGCDEFPPGTVWRRKKPEEDTGGEKDPHMFSKYAPEAPHKTKTPGENEETGVTKEVKAPLVYPPYVGDRKLVLRAAQEEDSSNWYGKVSSWLDAVNRPGHSRLSIVQMGRGVGVKPPKSAQSSSVATKSTTGSQKSTKAPAPGKNVRNIPHPGKAHSSTSSVKPNTGRVDQKLQQKLQSTEKESDSKINKRTNEDDASIASTFGQSRSRMVVDTETDADDTDAQGRKKPYSNYLTIKVPAELGKKRKFIHALVERKRYEETKKAENPEHAAHVEHEEEKRKRETWYGKPGEPLQMLHEDERDSDVWTLTTTTTTNSYASWRRLPDLNNAAKKMENLASTVDNTLTWRLILLFFVCLELARFVKKRIDDVYYGMFSFYLRRENIWIFELGLFAPVYQPRIVVVQEYLHLFISILSLSIIHRKNECVSLPFAFSLMIDAFTKVGITSHDSLIEEESLGVLEIVKEGLILMWKSLIICLFIAYHYYSAGYIRKAREFKHRKTKLHNHEINVKGTKGLLKRRLAWNWMIHHARNTNLRKLRKLFPYIKDGNFPEEDIKNLIKFNEAKELRLYAQHHNLNIGYPYNKLKDMKRYVFGELEKSDYTSEDETAAGAGGETEDRKKMTSVRRVSKTAITMEKWRLWKQKEKERRELASQRSERKQNRHR